MKVYHRYCHINYHSLRLAYPTKALANLKFFKKDSNIFKIAKKYNLPKKSSINTLDLEGRKSSSSEDSSETLVFDLDDTLLSWQSSSWFISFTASMSSCKMILCLSMLQSLYFDMYACLSLCSEIFEFGILRLSQSCSLKNLSFMIGFHGLSGTDFPRDKLLACGMDQKIVSSSCAACIRSSNSFAKSNPSLSKRKLFECSSGSGTSSVLLPSSNSSACSSVFRRSIVPLS